MATAVIIIHTVTCILLIALVLIQSGKGAEISASFGGSSQTVFGSSGGATFFQKITVGAAAVFMTTSLVLTVIGATSQRSLMEGAVPQQPASSLPSGPVSAPKPAK